MALSPQKSTTITSPQPGKAKRWILAARPPTLPAVIVPVLVGSAAAYSQGAWSPGVFVAALFSALLLQIGTNIANDLFDFERGADTGERLGPVRVTQAGLLTPAEVRRGMWLTFFLAFLIGLYLVYIGGWPILVIGLLSILCGLWYTAGPFPLAYHGLGDLFAFLFFGIVAVCGTFYVHTLRWDAGALWISLPVGALVTGIIVVNNYRDIETDRKANKRTLAVRLGAKATRAEYLLLLGSAYAVPLYLWLAGGEAWGWLPLLTLPYGFFLARAFLTRQGRALNAVLKGTGKLHLLHGLLLALSLIL